MCTCEVSTYLIEILILYIKQDPFIYSYLKPKRQDTEIAYLYKIIIKKFPSRPVIIVIIISTKIYMNVLCNLSVRL